MQRVKLIVSTICLFAPVVPLRCQLLEIVVDILLELSNVLSTERMRDSLSLSGMLIAVSSIEEATLDRDEGIVVVTVERWLACVFNALKV